MENLKQKEKYLGKYEIDKDGFLNLKDFLTDLFHLHHSYIGKFLDEENTNPEYPYIGDSLRFNKKMIEDAGLTYPQYKIHKDDIEEFIKRIKQVC